MLGVDVSRALICKCFPSVNAAALLKIFPARSLEMTQTLWYKVLYSLQSTPFESGGHIAFSKYSSLGHEA